MTYKDYIKLAIEYMNASINTVLDGGLPDTNKSVLVGRITDLCKEAYIGSPLYVIDWDEVEQTLREHYDQSRLGLHDYRTLRFSLAAAVIGWQLAGQLTEEAL